MPIKKIGSPDPKYLAATDILISDMSNINYDFLLYNRPIILLANKWLRENFPDLGIKTGPDGLEESIIRSINKPDEFEENRIYWHKKTMYEPDGNSSVRVIDAILEHSKIKSPFFLLIHGDNIVAKVHLDPLYEVIKVRGFNCDHISYFNSNGYGDLKNLICISTHNKLLPENHSSYNVHIDHSVKGAGVTDFEKQFEKVNEMNYYPFTNLHITEGEVSFQKTKKLLKHNSDRVIMVGYPKSDTLIKLNTPENKKEVFDELGFDAKNILITYAPTGKYSYPFKQGASLSREVLCKINAISKRYNYNILIKLRSITSFKNKIINILVNR